jgi:methylase of polypeptide subunit release factors
MAIQRYKGVDLSETALALAAENLKSLSCPSYGQKLVTA